MKLKSYHSDTVEAAIRLASVELGEDAVFLGSRKSDSDEPAGRYEVTFAVLDPDQQNSGGRANAAGARSRPQQAERTRSGRDARNQAPRAADHSGPARDNNSGGLVRFPHWRNFVPPELAEDLNKNGLLRQASLVPGRERTPNQQDDALAVRTSGDHERAVAGVQQESRRRRPRNETEPIRLGIPGEPVTGKRLSGDRCETGETFENGRADPAPAFAASAAVPSPPPREDFVRSPAWKRSPQPKRDSLRVISQTPLTDSLVQIAHSIEQLRAHLEDRLQEQPARRHSAGRFESHPLLAALSSTLAAHEIEPELALQLVSGLPASGERELSPDRLGDLLAGRLRSLCRTENTLGRRASQPRIAAFIGPSGAGKTTAVAKLAIRYGLGTGKKVHLIGVDPLRVGACQQLEAYAALLDVPLTLVGEVEYLPRVLESLSSDEAPHRPELVLVDTPGYGRAEWSQARRLANCLSGLPAIDLHLVMNLTTRSRDLRRSVESYQLFRPEKLLFTKLDETECYGSLLNESARTNLPLSFFSTGQRVPEDLAPATEPYLAGLILGKDPLGHHRHVSETVEVA